MSAPEDKQTNKKKYIECQINLRDEQEKYEKDETGTIIEKILHETSCHLSLLHQSLFLVDGDFLFFTVTADGLLQVSE